MSARSTFTLQINGHDRDIISYEVVLGNVERMQIGWINEARYIENLTNDQNNGVGEEANSLALDCCRGGLLNQGEFTKLDGLSIGSGSVIRCEQKARRWLVNGRLVVSSIASDDAVHFDNGLLPSGHVNGKEDKIIPSFSGKVKPHLNNPSMYFTSTILISCLSSSLTRRAIGKFRK